MKKQTQNGGGVGHILAFKRKSINSAIYLFIHLCSINTERVMIEMKSFVYIE